MGLNKRNNIGFIILFTLVSIVVILTGNDNGHLTRVNQKQIGTVHEHHIALHFRSVVTHSTVQISEYKRYSEMGDDP